jgi:hypothetical protein
VTTIAFMTAHYVARPIGYHMTEGWMQGDSTTNDYFKPIATFAARFDTYCADIQAMGFAALDIWLAILNPAWATPEHIQIASDLLQKRQLQHEPEHFDPTDDVIASFAMLKGWLTA